MNRFVFFLLLCVSTVSYAEEEHHFAGKHFVASYYDCDHEALTNLDQLRLAMHKAVALSGATTLSFSDYVFPPHGLTMVWLLSESHASIHTYPECNCCFVDLFTCGQNCFHEKFESYIESYLKPGTSKKQVIIRD